MLKSLRLWIKDHYFKTVNSIAFYPALIGILFLIISFLAISFDFSEQGKAIKSRLSWLRLQDATTARSIISSIVAGVISLTVFSFSMVMIVLNQTASQMSNRILDKLIGNRFQQIVLGIYIGTIVYALFLLSTIRDIDSGVYVPALSTYLLILLTVFDIFLFIYFLHYITQSVKYEVIIQKIYRETEKEMKKSCCLTKKKSRDLSINWTFEINSDRSGVYEGFDSESLVTFCNDNNCVMNLFYPPGTYILKNQPVVRLDKRIEVEKAKVLLQSVYINPNESIEANFSYGLRQLMEVAVKALSPGVNDPATAIQSLRALIRLLSYRSNFFPDSIIENEDGDVKIIVEELTFEEIFKETVIPIWDYGKNDRLVQNDILYLLEQLRSITNISYDEIENLIEEVKRHRKNFKAE